MPANAALLPAALFPAARGTAQAPTKTQLADVSRLEQAAFDTPIALPTLTGPAPVASRAAPVVLRAVPAPLSPLGDPPAPPAATLNPAALQSLRDGASYIAGFSGDPGTSVVAFMFVLQKILNKEAAADQKDKLSAQAEQLTAQCAELDLEKTKIGQMKTEAQDRYDHAMAAANIQMVIGIAQAAASALSAIGGMGGGAGEIGEALSAIGKVGDYLGKGEELIKTATGPLLAHLEHYAEFQQAQGLASDATGLQIDDQKKSIDKKTLDASNAKDHWEQARDRRKAGLESIQKLLDMLFATKVQV